MSFNINRMAALRLFILPPLFAGLTATSALAHNPSNVKDAVSESLLQEFAARQTGRKCKSLAFNSKAAFKAAKDLKASLKAAGHNNKELTQAAFAMSIKQTKTRPPNC